MYIGTQTGAVVHWGLGEVGRRGKEEETLASRPSGAVVMTRRMMFSKWIAITFPGLNSIPPVSIA